MVIRMESNNTGVTTKWSLLAVGTCLRMSCGVIFIISGMDKIRQPYDFLIAFYQYQLLGPPIGRFVAMVLPYIELTVGLCLVGGLCVQGSLLLSAVLLVMFSVAIGTVLTRHLLINCACFGFDREFINGRTLARSLVILGVVVLTYDCNRRAVVVR
jgi:uncharacterized membrane protein YphA (DoxX/SURF4 family)